MLTKEEFADKIFSNIDEMYVAYKKVDEKALNPADDLLSHRNNLPEFHASDVILSTAEKDKMIEELGKSENNEKLILTIGKVVLALVIASAVTAP
jgi:hypothetical protein